MEFNIKKLMINLEKERDKYFHVKNHEYNNLKKISFPWYKLGRRLARYTFQ